MITYKGLYNFFGVAALLAYSHISGAKEFSYSLSPNPIEPGQRSKLNIQLKLDGTVALRTPKSFDSIEVQDDWFRENTKYTLLDHSTQKEANLFQLTYEITAYLPGKLTIPPIEISLQGRNYSTESLSLEVLPTLPPDELKLNPHFGWIDQPTRWPKWLWPALIIAFLTAVLTPFVRRWIQRYWPKPAPATEPAPPVETASEWLRRQLGLYREKLNTEPSRDELVDELVYIVRTYFAKKYGVPAQALTTHEFFTRLPNTEKYASLAPVFKQCDHFKFSKGSTAPFPLAQDCLQKAEQVLL